MQNLHHQTGWKIRYNLAPESVNSTHPVDTPAQFFHQRARWASKGSHYPDPLTTALLVAIYLLSPLDLIPGFLPVIGQLDDFGLLLVTLSTFIRLAPDEVVKQYLPASTNS